MTVCSSAPSASLYSMTGYARVEGRLGDGSCDWVWDLRSVNAKGLDIRCRLPNGYEALEKSVRDVLSKALARGSINLTLTVNRTVSQQNLRINQDWLATLVDVAEQWCVQKPSAIQKPTFDGLLQVKGVVEAVDAEQPEEAETAVLQRAMLLDLERATEQLQDARLQEGRRMGDIVHELITQIAELVSQAEVCAELRTSALRDRLQRQVSELMATQSDVPQERLAQELAVLATRYDVREELDRLVSHIQAAQDLLAQGRSIGRKFDFLCQEFNREANTLCSKASDSQLTAVGLELKTAIDRLREQIQNIE